MTPDEFLIYHAKHAPRVIEYVRNATGPVYVVDIIDALADGDTESMNTLVWSMTGQRWLHDGPYELVMKNDLTIVERK